MISARRKTGPLPVPEGVDAVEESGFVGLKGLQRKTSIVGSMLAFGHSLRRLGGRRSEEADQSSNVLCRSCHQGLFSYVPKPS